MTYNFFLIARILVVDNFIIYTYVLLLCCTYHPFSFVLHLLFVGGFVGGASVMMVYIVPG